MTQVCKICTHPKRLEIDREVVKGRAIAEIAREFSVSNNSLYNHAASHVSRQLSQAMEKKATDEQFNLLDRINEIIKRAEDIFLRNYNKGADVTALKALAEARSSYELLAKISYSLHQAKLAEIELARLQSGEGDQQAQIEFQDQIKILTLEELKIYLQLNDKISQQDKSMEILPDKEPEIWEAKPRLSPSTADRKRVPETTSNDTETAEEMRVRPIVPIEMPPIGRVTLRMRRR